MIHKKYTWNCEILNKYQIPSEMKQKERKYKTLFYFYLTWLFIRLLFFYWIWKHSFCFTFFPSTISFCNCICVYKLLFDLFMFWNCFFLNNVASHIRTLCKYKSNEAARCYKKNSKEKCVARTGKKFHHHKPMKM